MATILIFHGVGGSPQENWFPWLQTNLEKEGHTVLIPGFPDADRPLLDAWTAHFEPYREQLNQKAVLVGHSLGSAFALRCLERCAAPVHATFLIAPVWGTSSTRS